jgi:outer membrane protein assembly factor BamB
MTTRRLPIARRLIAVAFLALLPISVRTAESKDEPAKKEPAEAKQDADKNKKEAPAADNKPAEKQADKQAAEKVPPVRNPLTDLIKRVLRPGNLPQPGATPALEQADQKPKTPANRHAADPRAPYDTKVGNWLRRLQSALKDRAWRDAMDLLPRITEQPEDSLTLNDAAQWVSVRSELRRILAAAPEEFLSEYRLQYGGLAKQLLHEALRSGDAADFGRIAGTYFHTESGYAAANHLGTLHLDRGEFELASYWFSALWQAKAPITRDALWRTKAAGALKQSGAKELSATILSAAPDVSHSRVDIGGERRDAIDWLGSVPSAVASIESTLREWPMFYGNSRRAGIAAGGEPLLMPRWRQTITDSHPVATQLEYLLEDLGDQPGAHLPLLFPTLVSGKVIFRTLHGVAVADAESGRVLWETQADVSPEQLLGGNRQPASQPTGLQLPGLGLNRVLRFRTGINSYNNGAAEYTPLCNLLYRNLNFGTVSSDGRQVFVLDDLQFLTNRQPGQNWGWDGSQDPPTAGATKLTSYDLETGRLLWEIGGMGYGEEFDRPLAGHFFFGPPTVDGDELFVVGESTFGERSGEVRLFCLDPHSGSERWSQLLAFSQSGIEKDVGRRWWSAQPAFDRGVIVCPTTVGWVLGLDRVTRSILWGYRIPLPNGNNRFGEPNEMQWMVQNTALSQRWSPAPPVIAGGHVVLTPLESQNLVCLDLATGKELWSKPRGNGLFLGGVVDGRVLLVGSEGVTAYGLEDGAQKWTAKTAVPAGRGVVADGRYYLPLSSGEVWGIQLPDGTVASKSYLPAGADGLGNLAMYRGKLYSFDALGITAFEQREAIHAEIARRKTQNPQDAWALLREAEIELLNRDVPAALKRLRGIPSQNLDTEDAARLRKLKIEALTRSIRSDLAHAESERNLGELLTLVASPAERQAADRLQAEMFLAAKDYSRAFDAFLKLADQPAGEMIVDDDDAALQVRADLWAAGRIRDLLEVLPEAGRSPIDERISQLAVQAAERTIADREKFIRLFGTHPQADAMRRDLAEDAAQRGDFITAEHLLRELQRSTDRNRAAAATERLARLLLSRKLEADAAACYRELELYFADAVVTDGKTGAQWVADLRESGGLPSDELATPDWHVREVRLERTGANYSNSYLQELNIAGTSAPYFRSARFDVKQVEQRMEISDVFDDHILWSLPLRSKGGSSEGGLVLATSSGRLLTLLHRGVIHALSPVDRRILWTHPLESRAGSQNYYGRNQNPLQPMQQAAGYRNRSPGGSGGSAGGLNLANHQIVCYQGRRTLHVLDAMTGEPRWTMSGIRPGSLVLGNEQFVFVRPSDGSDALALRSLDGKPLKVPGLTALLNRAIQVTERGVILTESSTQPPLVKVQLHDPISGNNLWSTEFPRGVMMSVVDHDRIALLDPSGKFDLLDLRNGAVQTLGTVAAEDLKGRQEAYVLADNLNVYLLINRSGQQNYYSEQVPFVRINGMVLAFDPRADKLRWKQAVTSQNLVLERLDFSPFLVFATRKYERKGAVHVWSLSLLALDKQNGARLIDVSAPSQPGFRSVTVNAAERFVELRGYNERVRLYPIEERAAAGQSSD